MACAEFVWRDLRDEGGRLLRTYKDGRARLAAYLEDYAYLVEALLTLYEATFDVRWFDAARETADLMIELFADPDRGGFFTTAHDHEQLIARRKDVDDHPIPSGNSAAAFGLLRLAALTGEHEYERHAVGVFRLLHQAAASHPQALAHLLPRWTSTSRRSRRWRWWVSPRATAWASSRRSSAPVSGRTWCWRADRRAPSARS